MVGKNYLLVLFTYDARCFYHDEHVIVKRRDEKVRTPGNRAIQLSGRAVAPEDMMEE